MTSFRLKRPHVRTRLAKLRKRSIDWPALLLALGPGLAAADASMPARTGEPAYRTMSGRGMPLMTAAAPAAPSRLPQEILSKDALASSDGKLPLRLSTGAELVLLEVRLEEHLLADTLTSYHHQDQIFLPLGELSRLLTLAITAKPEEGTAQGFILTEDRGFSLNVGQGKLLLSGQLTTFDPALVQAQSDDIYVAASLLSDWLPLEFDLNLSALTLRVRSRERLPLQARLERERLAETASLPRIPSGQHDDPGLVKQPTPYRLLGVPFIDQTIGVGVRAGQGEQQISAGYTAYLTADLLGMESALFVSTSKENPGPDVRFTLARHDPDAGLLGPMHARSVIFGSGVTVSSIPNVAARSPRDKGYGLVVSNRPIGRPASFDRHTIQGDLPPGWDVELYFNDALIGLQTARPEGRYSFEDLPLAYGLNEFRLVFHGPLGQQRVERQSFLLEESGIPPGAFFYNLSHYQDAQNSMRSAGQFEWGLSKYMTATGGFALLPPLENRGPGIRSTAMQPADSEELYTNVGLRAFWRKFIFSSDLFRSPNGGLLNESGVKTRLGTAALSLSRTLLKDFSSEVFMPSDDPLRIRDRLRLDGAVRARSLSRLPVSLELTREQFASGRTSYAVTGRLAAYVRQTAISNQLTWQTTAGNSSGVGALQLSRRFGGIGLSGQLGYTFGTETKLETVVLSGNKYFRGGYQLNLGVVRSVRDGEMVYTAGLNKSLGRFGFGVGTTYASSGHVTAGLQFFIGMGREPRQGQWRFSALPSADSGTASVRVFQDTNGNGVMDSGEEPIENVAISVNGSRAPERTNAEGIVWLDRLPVRQHVAIAVDSATLEDPYWIPEIPGVRMVPRPGHVAQIDFPVNLTSEIDGTVYLMDNSGKRGIGDVILEVLDAEKRQVLHTLKTSSDGYFVAQAVKQGQYFVRISPQQLARLGLNDPGMRMVTVAPDGKFISGVDFVLSRQSPGKAPGFPPGEADKGK